MAFDITVATGTGHLFGSKVFLGLRGAAGCEWIEKLALDGNSTWIHRTL